MKSPTEMPRKIQHRPEFLTLVFALLLVLFIAVFTYRAWATYVRTRGQAVVTRQVVDGVTALLSSLKDAETGQRGFLLTGEDGYLEPYRQALVDIPARLGDLVRVAVAQQRPDQLQRLERLNALITDKLDELSQTIALQRDSGPNAALAMVRSDRGKRVMDQIRVAGSEIQTASYVLLEREAEEARAAAYQAGLAGTLGSTAVFALLLLATITIQRETRRRQQLIETLQVSERETKETRDLLQTTIASIGDAVIATDAEGRVTFLNGVAQSLTGWQQEEAAGKPLEEIFVITNEDTGAIAENPVSKVLREGRVVGLANHTGLKARDGRRIPIEDSAAPIRTVEGNISGVVLIFRDVTERQRSEEALRRALEFDEAVMANMGEGLYTVDEEGLVTSMNPVAEDLFGWRFEELRGRKMHEMTHHHHPDGTPFPAEECAGLQVLQQGKTLIDHQDVFIRKDGTFFDVVYSSSALKSGATILGLVVVFRDVSEQKRVADELRRNAEELRLANEDLNQFAFAASHDLQEPLRMITSYSELLFKGSREKLEGEAALCLNFITEGTQRMRELLEDLLAYTQVNTDDGSRAVELVDLNSIFRKTVENLNAAIQESKAVVTTDPLPAVLGYEPHFLQLLQNLIGNAVKYRGEKAARVHVSASETDGMWQLTVADNGIGIDPQYHERIFGVFKRLHGKNVPGTGIGLAICKRVVDRYGGRIWVESQLNQGATILCTLPPVKAGSYES